MEQVFKTEGRGDTFILRNQDREIRNFQTREIKEYLEEMFEDPDQFVTLSAPEAQEKVRYVQACIRGEGVNVELGIEEEDGTHLVYKICSREECVPIFLAFFEGAFLPKLEEYQPVQF